MTLRDELASLSPALRARLAARGFDPDRLLAWAAAMQSGRDRKNRLTGRVEPPATSDVVELPADAGERARLDALGRDALARGDVALCVLAGGMATRMGGVVKALADALPGKTFLDLRLAENDRLAKIAGAPVPLWLMTSEATDAAIRKALGPRLDAGNIATFEQCVSLRLTPEGGLFHDASGEPSVHATGHGDLPEALQKSGLVQKFAAGANGRTRTVWIANIDNLGATVDPLVLGFHLSRGTAATVELVSKVGSDRGGGPVRHDGQLIITEEFRLPTGFDPTTVPVFNTNTFLVDASRLASLNFAFTYVEVEKKVGDAKSIQFERLLGEITVPLASTMLRVPREGTAARFLPVKDLDELERRKPEIEAIARARGLL